ncbi:unnamed protein product [Amoebophrya sp. A120]|nr:unnamed protein product [Amoebophrya sp. A120]|eukprot:GSA120T00005804001.1
MSSASSTAPMVLSWDGLAKEDGFSRVIKAYYTGKEGKEVPEGLDYAMTIFKYKVTPEKVAVIVWDNPTKFNALDWTTNWEMLLMLEFFERSDNVHVLLWVSSTNKAFCAGADATGPKSKVPKDIMAGYKKVRKGLCEDFPDGEDQAQIDFALKGLVLRFHTFPKISVVASTGVAVGGGANIVLMLHDFVFVDGKSTFRYPFTELGVTGEVSSTFVLPRVLGNIRAKDLLMSGRWFSGEECVKQNLATQLCTDQKPLLSTACEFATKLAKSSQVSLRTNKQLINRQTDELLTAQMNSEQRDFIACMMDPETQKLWMALREKVNKNKKLDSKL